jgi:tRNA(adenine34) deaminase
MTALVPTMTERPRIRALHEGDLASGVRDRRRRTSDPLERTVIVRDAPIRAGDVTRRPVIWGARPRMSNETDAVDALSAMGVALEEARRAMELDKLPIAAVVVAGGEVVATRHTEDRGQRRRLVHADLLALDDADRLGLSMHERAAASLVVTLEPCPMCLGAAMTFGIGDVVFALESPSDGAADLFSEWDRQPDLFPGYSIPSIVGGVRRDDARALFRAFVERPGPHDGYWRWALHLAESI